MTVFRRLRSLFNPEIYQGWGRNRSYFEGWYFKVLSSDEKSAFAIIPGVAMDKDGNRHAFVQVLDGFRKKADYHRFDFSEFIPSSENFSVVIGSNHFSAGSASLDLPGLRGELNFSGNVPWPKPWYSPGIMGPYTFAPFMQCYHGIVSMDHSIDGVLEYSGKKIDFTGGRGYIEKDWGSSFPEGYIWIQSNHFSEPGVSLKTSIAKIPWLSGSFTGFISGVWLHDRLIRFTTYNGSSLKKVAVEEGMVEIVLQNKTYLLEMVVFRDTATALASPLSGHMDGRIEESMSSEMDVSLTERKSGKVIFSGKGRNVAVEVAGNVGEILL
ncbi:MAG: hypothetical protein EA408_03660 [Marinilabiliales bacterium]|nr:MAG: hypothetical protein EA408_03660 [Marinilabiliales bacterium]